VSELQLASFRNYTHLSLSLSPGTTVFHGSNGEGKTNLVEAIVYLSQLASHRSGNPKLLIQNGYDQATISATAHQRDRKLLVAAELNREGANRSFLGGNLQRRASDFLGNLPVVLFAPEDLDIVRRDPEDRRQFLDSNLALIRPRLAQLRLDYDKVLKQRNALLRSAKQVKNPDLRTLDIWDEQIAVLGSRLTLARLELILQLSPLLQDFYNKLSASTEEIIIRLVSLDARDQTEEISQQDLEQILLARLQSLRPQELERGLTLAGPHRDELLIEKDLLPVRTQASQGEAWSIALGLKLAMAQLLREGSLGDPVVILDDVFSVLDPGRRNRMAQFVVGFEQVLITASDLALSPELELSATYSVEGGQLLGN
jgi:DNA replication and repair protein RecF